MNLPSAPGRRHAMRLMAGAAGAACLHLMAGCASTEVSARAPNQSPALDTDEAGLWQVMEKAEGEIATSAKRFRDPALEEYVRQVVCNVAADHCADVRVYLIRAPFFNASMAPNGMMQIWTGGLLRMENEAQLAAIAAHEVGHFIERHSLENFRRLKNNAAAATFVGMGLAVVGAGPLANVGYLAAVADLLAFSREQERAADDAGLRVMTEAGYAPSEFASLWENEVAERDADPDAKEKDLFLSTHPAQTERLATISKAAEAMAAPGQRVGKDEYLERLRPHRADFLEDELQLRQPDRTLHLLERLAGADPDAADLHHYTGEVKRLRQDEGDLADARSSYQRALAIDPGHARAWRGLGIAERAAGNREAAAAAFRQYLELEPEAPDAAFLQAYLASAG